jgi:D-3-phosphoglycerate dehydrogenase
MDRVDFPVIYTGTALNSFGAESQIIESLGGQVAIESCQTAQDLIDKAQHAYGVLLAMAPFTASVADRLENCRIVVRLGIGVDGVDLDAAAERGIAVCNVPDYGINEVADHAVSLALSLGRQLKAIDRAVTDGIWENVPPRPMPAFREQTFATLGFGRIAQAVLHRAAAFGFHTGACDPYLPVEAFRDAGVERLSINEVFERSDFLSLHCPLTSQTQRLVNASNLGRMKPTAVLVNTARGGIVDSAALLAALDSGGIAGAGLDVFEDEPLPRNHPFISRSNVVLTSHVAWYSELSVPTLLRKALQEVARQIRGEPLLNRLNSPKST